jgi:hypothetical protein
MLHRRNRRFLVGLSQPRSEPEKSVRRCTDCSFRGMDTLGGYCGNPASPAHTLPTSSRLGCSFYEKSEPPIPNSPGVWGYSIGNPVWLVGGGEGEYIWRVAGFRARVTVEDGNIHEVQITRDVHHPDMRQRGPGTVWVRLHAIMHAR